MSKQGKSSTQGREALRRRQQAQAAAERRMKTVVRTAWIAGITVIALIIGITVWSVTNARSSNTAGGAPGALVTPTRATDAGALRFGKDDAKVTVAVYADFMCPYCGQFERANGASLDAAAEAGTIVLDIHPMSFLDAQSGGTEYSTRAANAFVTIAEADPAAALRFNQLLFANQPGEGTSGLSDDQLASFATQAGASGEVIASFAKRTFVPWIDQITQQAFDAGVKGTPTVKLNGQVYSGDIYTPGALMTAIERVAAGA
ncbi:MAG TPA: thioredoxin domain-containing protein [Micropruina sp.]|nr:thioredoxin domain-containing protein [Micropruina sp.]